MTVVYWDILTHHRACFLWSGALSYVFVLGYGSPTLITAHLLIAFATSSLPISATAGATVAHWLCVWPASWSVHRKDSYSIGFVPASSCNAFRGFPRCSMNKHLVTLLLSSPAARLCGWSRDVHPFETGHWAVSTLRLSRISLIWIVDIIIIEYFSVVLRHRDQKNLQSNALIPASQFQRVRSMAADTGSTTKGGERESANWKWCGCGLLKGLKGHSPWPSQQFYQLGTKYLNIWASGTILVQTATTPPSIVWLCVLNFSDFFFLSPECQIIQYLYLTFGFCPF